MNSPDIPDQETDSFKKTVFTTLTIIFGTGAALIGMLGIIGMYFGIPLFTSFFPGYKTIAFSASVTLILFGSVLACHAATPFRGGVRTCTAAVVALIAILTALEFPLNILGKHFIVETWSVQLADAISAQPTTPISPVAVILLITAAIALFFMLYAYGPSKEEEQARDVVGILGLAISLVSFTFVLSYLYHTPFMYDTPLIPIAFIPAIAALIIGAGLVTAAGPRAIPLKYITGSSTRARLLRFFLPLTLIIILVQNFLMIAATSYYNINNTVLLSFSVIVFSIVTIYVIAKASTGVSADIDRAKRERGEAESKLEVVQVQYRELFESINIGILRSTPEPKGALIEVNPAALRIFEADSREQLFAIHPSDLYLDPDQRRRISEEILAKGVIIGMEIRYKTLKGRPIWGRISSTKKISEDGQTYFDNTIEDITERKQAEEALQHASERLLLATHAGGIGIWELDLVNNNLVWDDQMFQLYGIGPDTFSGTYEAWRAGVHPDDLSQSEAELGMAIRGEKEFDTEFRVIWPDGTIHYLHARARVHHDAAGKPVIMVGTNYDVTDRKRAEEQIQKSETQHRRLFESAKDGILILNRDTGEIIDANPFIQTLIGYSRQELIGKHLWDIGLFKDMLLSKIAFEELQSKEYLRYEDLPLQTKDGQRIEAEFISTFYAINPQTSVIQCNIRDITDRKRDEDALRETTEYLKNLLDYANAPIIVWDIKFRITRFNHAFERLTGRTEKEVIGQQLAILFPIVSRETSLEQIKKTLAGERWEIVEIPILHVSGETRIVLWNSANIVDPNGAIISTIAQGQDITDRKLTEVQRELLIQELEQKNSELERFTYTVSHDLKSPLITIKGFAGLLEDDALKCDPLLLKKDIHRIIVAAETMQALLSDLLELSRVGRLINPQKMTGFGTIAREAVDLLAGPLAKRSVTVEIAPDLPVVAVDHARIRELMVNLIENSIKFLGDRPDPVIRIGVNMNGETPVFFVEDNGIGINPRYLERIFNLFERLDASALGTGIGLTIARRIIEAHGGKIWVESEGEGKGTTVWFTLPAAQ